MNTPASAIFSPLITEDCRGRAAASACEIYCTIVKEGWEAACNIFPRELIVAFEWSANPIMWTYTTVHTLVKKNAEVETAFSARQRNLRTVLIVELDAESAAFAAMVCQPATRVLRRSLAEDA